MSRQKKTRDDGIFAYFDQDFSYDMVQFSHDQLCVLLSTNRTTSVEGTWLGIPSIRNWKRSQSACFVETRLVIGWLQAPWAEYYYVVRTTAINIPPLNSPFHDEDLGRFDTPVLDSWYNVKNSVILNPRIQLFLRRYKAENVISYLQYKCKCFGMTKISNDSITDHLWRVTSVVANLTEYNMWHSKTDSLQTFTSGFKRKGRPWR